MCKYDNRRQGELEASGGKNKHGHVVKNESTTHRVSGSDACIKPLSFHQQPDNKIYRGWGRGGGLGTPVVS